VIKTDSDKSHHNKKKSLKNNYPSIYIGPSLRFFRHFFLPAIFIELSFLIKNRLLKPFEEKIYSRRKTIFLIMYLFFYLYYTLFLLLLHKNYLSDLC